MDMQIVTRFLKLCTILNMGVLLLSSLILVFAGDYVYMIHDSWFPMQRDTFNLVVYAFLGMYKIFWLMFNVTPWAALVIIGKK